MFRSDGGGEFSEGAFEELYDMVEKVTQEKPIADSPRFNGGTERAIGIMKSAGPTVKIQAS